MSQAGLFPDAPKQERQATGRRALRAEDRDRPWWQKERDARLEARKDPYKRLALQLEGILWHNRGGPMDLWGLMMWSRREWTGEKHQTNQATGFGTAVDCYRRHLRAVRISGIILARMAKLRQARAEEA